MNTRTRLLSAATLTALLALTSCTEAESKAAPAADDSSADTPVVESDDAKEKEAEEEEKPAEDAPATDDAEKAAEGSACDDWEADFLDRDLQDACMAEMGERVYSAEERAAWVDALRAVHPGLVAESGAGFDSLQNLERDMIYRGIDTCTAIADGPGGEELLEQVAMRYYIDHQQIDTALAAEVVDAAEEHIC
ncbi:hypothetical protein [Streptomyces spiramenti]|uniref:Lipoprotein n=1 Tax=Streptomyces spiramenti TaxID=2720606 RepID=A0ABX1AGY5_9ACTN|nr:hypothetical protein [Streptomyces spiramenti]NJP66442.1 hypothetical protein [Streptomyces spiramenti]